MSVCDISSSIGVPTQSIIRASKLASKQEEGPRERKTEEVLSQDIQSVAIGAEEQEVETPHSTQTATLGSVCE